MRKPFSLNPLLVPPTLLTLPILLALIALPATAQIPDEFTNLQVLPKDISKGELVGMMRGFAGALGVRCIHCHLGDDPRDLSTVDFASDQRPAKATARVMMRMVQEINGPLLGKLGRDHKEVACYSCHRGLEQPTSLRDELLTAFSDDGVEAVMALYKALRAEHYGRGKYDFGGPTLSGLAEQVARDRKDPASAIKIAQFNLEQNPDFEFGWVSLGQLYMGARDQENALKAFTKALEKSPDEPYLRRMVARLKKAPAEE